MKPEQFADFANSILSAGLMRYNDEGEPAQPTAVTAAHALAAKVDRLGKLAADAAAIKLEADKLRAELEAAGLTEIHGLNYRASFTPCKGAKRIDWKAISAKFKPSRQLIAAHTTTGRESVRMTITAHPTH
jgi:preprotein translocase subunit Sec61beta